MPSLARQKSFNRRDALALWHSITLDTILDKGPELTHRQFAILSTVYLAPGPHTVRSLAGKLNVTKAVICRALDTLNRYDFIIRRSDPNDKRSIIVQRTGPGSKYLSRLGDQIVSQMKPRQSDLFAA